MKLISIKEPKRIVLEYDGFNVELTSSINFEHFVFCVSDDTFKRLEEKGVLAGPKKTPCKI